MKKNLRRVLCFAIALIFVFAASACGKTSVTIESTTSSKAEETQKVTESEKPVEPTIMRVYAYYQGDEAIRNNDAIKEIVEKKLPVKIEFIHRPDADDTKLKTMVATGDYPDICEVFGGGIAAFSKSGDLLKLNDEIDKRDFKSKVISAVPPTWYDDKGDSWAVSAYCPYSFMYWVNNKVMKACGLENPKNFADLLNVCKVLKENNYLPYTVACKDQWVQTMVYDSILVKFEPQGIKGLDNGTTKITDPAYKLAAQRFIDLCKAGFITKASLNYDWSQSREYFRTGKAAFASMGTWEGINSAEIEKDKLNEDDYSFILTDMFADADKVEATRWNFSGGNGIGGFGVLAKGKNVKLATDLVFEWSIAQNQVDVTIGGKAQSLVEKLTPAKRSKMQIQLNEEILPNIKTNSIMSFYMKNAELQAALKKGTESMIAGNMTADQFIESVQKVMK